jgi:DNA modification methylase
MSKVDKAKISDLLPDDKNYNKGTEFGESLLEKSLQNYGAGRSILLDKNNRIIAGNKTAQTAGGIGLDNVLIIESDGSKLIAVKRTDIDLDTKAGRELALADNAVSKVNLEWDEENLKQDFELKELEDWGIHLEDPEEIKEEESETPFVPEKAKTVLGDLYELISVESGITHRVQCGDSCDSDVVGKTMNGEFAILMATDPPYGVEYDPEWRNEAAEKGHISYAARSVGKVKNDDKINWTEAWSLFTGDVCYVWHADRHAKEVQESLENCGFIMISQIIWGKTTFAISRGDYHWQHEPCWYAHKKGKKHNWQGSRSESTLWDIPRSEMDTGHGTQKPLECMARPIRNNTAKGEGVYDPFLGSGTTLIACEQLGRICYGQELDEKYMDVIVQRWVNYMNDSGKEYKVLRNGEECIDFE